MKNSVDRHRSILIQLPLRIFLLTAWMRSSVEKLIEPDWWSGNMLRVFLSGHYDTALVFFRPLTRWVLNPLALPVSILVIFLELFIGIVIAIDTALYFSKRRVGSYGRMMSLALHIAIFLNVIFIMCGVVNPSAFYIIMEIVLLFAITDRTIDITHTQPRNLIMACAWFSIALALSFFVRTIEPEFMIADPASMLALIAFIMGARLVLHWDWTRKNNRDIE